MTIFDLRKTPLSPYLIRLIVRMYRDKLLILCGGDLLSKLLCYLGILEFERNPDISPTYANIIGVNRDVYDSYNKNPFFQWIICYHLDSIGLLYHHPRVYFDKVFNIKKCWSPTTRVRIPDGFIPQSRYESRKKAPKPFCWIDESLKFDPESFKTITEEEVNTLKKEALLKQEEHHYYLHSERNRAIKAINERRYLTSQQIKLRIERIDEKYQRNLTEYMEHVKSNENWSSWKVKHADDDVHQKEIFFLDLTAKMISLKVAEQMDIDEEKKQFASQRRIEHETKRNQAEASLVEEKVHLAELKVYYQAICAEATAVKQQFSTPELQERYFAEIQARKDA